MARAKPQSALRYPLTRMLGADANVRVLRELVGHGGALSAPALVVRTGLAQSSVRAALIALEEIGIVESIGSGRARLFRLTERHPLAPTLVSLFEAEEQRFNALLDAVRTAAARCGAGLVAIWLYGSVARGHDRTASDLDLAVVATPAALRRVEERVREELRSTEEGLAVKLSVVAADTDDIVRLAAANDPWWRSILQDALPLVGDRPELLLARLHRSRKGDRKAS